MNPTTLGLLLFGAYLLWKQGVFGAAAPRAAGVPVYTGTAAGSVVQVPGIGRYTSGPGGTQIALDPSFLGRLFGRGTGESLPDYNQPGADSPVFPAGTSGLAWSLGGAIDAYRAGERDPIVTLDTVPLEPTLDPAAYFPQDVEPAPFVDPCSAFGACDDGSEWIAL